LKVAHFYPQESNDANVHHEGLLGKYSNKQAEIDQISLQNQKSRSAAS
jgi:hypothetical protein